MISLYKKFCSVQHLILIFIVFLSFAISIFKSIYNTDPHHFSFLFFDAYQISKGVIPYSEINILYGIVTTIIHYLSILVLGNYVLSISVVTGFLYALTFLFYYFILINIGLNKNYSLFIILLIFLIHPGILTPWSNYIAYFFLNLGIFFFTLSNKDNRNFFFLGLFLGLATLSRQTFFFSTFLFVIFINFISFTKKKKIILCLTYFSVLLVFFIYLFFNSLIDPWIISSIKAHSIAQYKDYHPGFDFNSNSFFNFLFLISPLLNNLFFSIPNLDLKWIFFLFLLFGNFLYLINFFFRKKSEINKKIFSISFLSLILFSESVHIPSIFKLSTGAVIGMIPISIYIFETINFLKKKINLKIRYLFILCSIFLFFLYFNKIFNVINYITHYDKKISEPNVSYLKYQRFPVEVSSFYEKFDLEIRKVRSSYPDIKFNYNFTSNCMLPIMSKTKNYQFSCMHGHNGILGINIWNNIYVLNPKISLTYKLNESDADIVIFQNVRNKNEIFSENFFIFSELNYPFKDNETLLILISKKYEN